MPGIIKPPVGAQLKLDHPLARGLVGCWLLNENSGNKAHDYSGNGNVGILTNIADPPTLISGWNPGPHGGWLASDGSNDYIDLLSPPSLDDIENQGGGGMSLIGWIYPTAFSSAHLLAKGGYTAGYWAFQLINFAELLAFRFQKDFDGANDLDAFTGWGSVEINKLQQVVVTWDGSGTANNIHFYINGVELSKAGTTNGAGNKVSDASLSLYIGAYIYGGSFPGFIDEACIYNRALSAQEVAWLYAFPYAMFEEESPYWIPFKAAGGGDQTLTCTAIAGAEAFGTAQLNLTILSAGAIATGEAFGVARLDFTILSADGIASAEAFGSGRIDLTVIAASIATAEAFGTAQLNLTLYASSIGSGEAFGTAVIIREGDVVGIYTGSMTLSMGMGL